MGIFQRLNREAGITMILVTHEPDIAAYTNRNIHLRDGQVVEDVRVKHPRQAPSKLQHTTPEQELVAI